MGNEARGSEYGRNKAGGLSKIKPFTESAADEFKFGSPEEVRNRLEGGTVNTESSFAQIKPSRSAPRGRSLAERTPGFARNGKMGRDTRHSGS